MKKIKNEKFLSFVDLKKGINLRKNNFTLLYNLDFFTLLMDSFTETEFNFDDVIFVFKSDTYKVDIFKNAFVNRFEGENKIQWMYKFNLFNLSLYSQETNKTIVYFDINNYSELILEVYHNGSEIDYDKYLNISKSINDQISNLCESSSEIKKKLSIDDDDFKKYLELHTDELMVKEEMFLDSFNLDQHFLLEEKVLFTFLDYKHTNEQNLNKYYEQTNMYFNFENSNYNIENPRAFKNSIKRANKLNINKIVLFEDGFKSFRIAIKRKKYWTLLDSGTQSSFYLHFLINDHYLPDDTKIYFDYESSLTLDKIIENSKLDTYRTLDVSFQDFKNNALQINDDFYVDINVSNINNFTTLIKFFNKYKLEKYLKSISEAYGNEEFKIINKDLPLDEWIELEKSIIQTDFINEEQATIKLIYENNQLVIYEIRTKHQKLTFKYYKIDEYINLDVTIIGNDRLTVLELSNGIKKNFLKYNLFGNKEHSEFSDKKTYYKIAITLLIFIALLIITFTKIIGIDTSSESLTKFFNSYTTFYFWILILNFIIAPILVTLPFYFSFKMLKKNFKFVDIFIAAEMTNFLILILPLPYLSLVAIYWYLKHKGFRGYEISSGIFITVILVDIFALIANGISLMYGLYDFSTVTNNYLIWTSLISVWGLMFSSFSLIIFGIIFISPWFHSVILNWLQSISLKFNKSEWYENKYSNIEYNLELVRESSKILTKKTSYLIGIVFVYILYYFWWELIMFSSIKIVDPANTLTFSGSIGIDTIIWEMSIWIPIPGKAGITELIGAEILNSSLNWIGTEGEQTMVLYRMWGWYFYGFTSFMVFFFYLFKVNVFKSKINKRNSNFVDKQTL